MLKILIDTNVWLDLAKDYRMQPVLTAIEELIKVGEIRLIVPRIVVDEFARNKDRVVEDSRRSLSSHFKRVREAVQRFGSAGQKAATIKQLNEIDHAVAMKGEVSNQAIAQIEQLLQTSPQVMAGERAKLRAAERALSKRAPFHLAKNSMADALLLELFADQVAANQDADTKFVFVTGNTRDFSLQHGDARKPHEDLGDIFDGDRAFYSVDLIEIIRGVDGGLLEEYEFEQTFHEEPRRLSEILEAEHLLFRQVWYNRHWNLRSQIERGEVKIVKGHDFTKRGYRDDVVDAKVWKGALAAAKKTEKEIGIESLGPWDDFEWGMINGKLSALRWVLGDEWDMLDT